MKTNPGGQIDPAQIIGRDELIDRLWEVLSRQSLVLTAERRMGKTSVVLKMKAESTDAVLPIYRDLERVQTPLEFTQLVFDDVSAYLTRLNRTTKRVKQFISQLSGTEVKGIIKLPEIAATHWKTLLTSTLEDLAEHQDRTVILFWDELPLMLYNIKRRVDEAAAIEILDTLRSLRQMNPQLRMVFTGSVGLHNVISSLRESGYVNDPTNDMYTVDVPPLEPKYARHLALKLFQGEHIKTDTPEECAVHITEAVDGIPYFIHHIIDELKQTGGKISNQLIDETVAACIADDQDRWHLRYYRDRIDVYYAPDDRPFALNILDILSGEDEPIPFSELFNRLKSIMITEDREKALQVVSQLQRDHYLERKPDGKIIFRYRLIKQSWRFHRGIE